MSMVRLASVVSVLIATQAMGASLVKMTPGLQSAAGAYTTYVSNWKAGGANITLYPSGSQANGQVFTAGSVITWDVTLEASGVQSSGAGAGSAIYGVANFVFDLELRSGTVGGPLVASAQFSSAINNGSGGDPSASAAFAAKYNLFNLGPGRVFDVASAATPPRGGPRADVKTYPTNMNNGTLLGMGAGYSSWNRTGGAAVITSPGIGMTTLPNGTAGAGIIPVCEGQLNTANLSQGVTYFLVVVPKPGTNVLRGDINLTQNQNAFAVAADSTQGGAISFTIGSGPTCTPVTLVSAVSRRVHGAAGTFDLTAPISGTPAREGRQAGSVAAMVLTFSGPPTKTNGAALTCSDFTITNGSCSAVNVSGNSAVIALSGLTKNTCLTVAATGVCLQQGTDADVSVILHEGQANADTAVNILDLQAIKNVLNQAVSVSNFRADVNVNGTINILDLQAAKNNLNQAASCP